MKNTSHPVAAAKLDTSAVIVVALDLAKSDAAYDNSIPSAAAAFARWLGLNPSYDKWVAGQEAFIAAYAKQRNCKHDTAVNRFSAVAVALERAHAQTKPKKPTAAAEKKAASRAKQADTKASLKAQCVTVADAVQKASKALEAGDVQKAIAFQAVAADMQKEAQTVAKKTASNALNDQRDKIRKALIDCVDLVALKKAYEIIVGNVPAVEPAAKPAKASKAKAGSKASPFDVLTKPALV